MHFTSRPGFYSLICGFYKFPYLSEGDIQLHGKGGLYTAAASLIVCAWVK